MKISKLIKGLELFKTERGDIEVETLCNVLDGEYKQYDSVTGITLIEPDFEPKRLVLRTRDE